MSTSAAAPAAPAAPAAVMTAVSSSPGHNISGVGTADTFFYTNSAVSAGGGGPGLIMGAPGSMAGGVSGSMAAATATAAAAGGEPMKRQRGRFKLRDIREVSISPAPTSTSSSSTAGAGGGGAPGGGYGGGGVPGGGVGGIPGGVSAGQLQPSSSPPVHVVTGPVSVGGPELSASSLPAIGTVAGMHSTLLVLVEQHRLLLERVGGTSALDVSGGGSGGSGGVGGSMSAPGPPVTASMAGGRDRSTVDRSRTASMSALTLQVPLPPKPPSAGAAAAAAAAAAAGGGGGVGLASDRKESPLMRDGTPAGWWGAQGQQGPSGQGQGQPPRRPSSAGLGRNELGMGPGWVGSSQSVGGGVGGGGMGVLGKVKDDGTGRRAERGRLSTLLDQLKDEIEFHACAKRDMDLELKRVRERRNFLCRLL